MNPIRIGIIGSYGGLNMGDEAILEAIVTEVRKSIQANITVFSRDANDTLKRHGVERAVNVRRLTRVEAKEEVGKLDFLILGGGGILFDREASHYVREVFLAQSLGIPTMAYAVSAGPLENVESRDAVRRALEGCLIVTVRDRQAKKLLEDLTDRDIVLTADPAFMLAPAQITDEDLRSEGLSLDRKLIGFSVREPGPAAPDIQVDHYHRLLANAADFMVERLNADIVFVPMEKGDNQHSHAVISQMQCAPQATVLKRAWSPGQLLSIISRFDFVVGMRLHFLLFAARNCVPFVALPYASKVCGLLEDFDMDSTIVSDVNPGRLLASIDRSWDHRHDIRKRIRAALPTLLERSRMTNSLLAELLCAGREIENQHTRLNAITHETYEPDSTYTSPSTGNLSR